MLNKKIPTIIGLLILLIGIASASYLTTKATNLRTKAAPTSNITGLTLSNVSDTGFTLSWITDGEIPQYVVIPESSKKTFCQPEYSSFSGPCYYDERDVDTHVPSKKITHHVNVDSLNASTNYTVKIFTSGSTEAKVFKNIDGKPMTTGPKIETGSASSGVIYGNFYQTENKTPASGALVYASTPKGSRLSTIVKSSGSWLITLSKLRTETLDNYLKITDNDQVQLEVVSDSSKKTVIKTSVSASQPLPDVNVFSAENFDFTTNSNNSNPPPLPTATPIRKSEGFSTQPTPIAGNGGSSSLTVTSPLQNSSTDDLPTFRGTGQPGQTVNIEVHSETALTADVRVNEDGTWSWTPPSNLPPGEHTVTITTVDQNGNRQTTTRTFIVTAGANTLPVTAGSESAQLSTPTPEPTPEPLESPTPSPIYTPEPIASSTPIDAPLPTRRSQEVPVTGNSLPFFASLTMGLLFVTLGLGLFVGYKKRSQTY